ncbi:hypothetical protein NX059_011867 [Plenodomus lindquistii]|nr:hypothetical protein NX059_011867 [Plenodomus lindquistii]
MDTLLLYMIRRRLKQRIHREILGRRFLQRRGRREETVYASVSGGLFLDPKFVDAVGGVATAGTTCQDQWEKKR